MEGYSGQVKVAIRSDLEFSLAVLVSVSRTHLNQLLTHFLAPQESPQTDREQLRGPYCFRNYAVLARRALCLRRLLAQPHISRSPRSTRNRRLHQVCVKNDRFVVSKTSYTPKDIRGVGSFASAFLGRPSCGTGQVLPRNHGNTLKVVWRLLESS